MKKLSEIGMKPINLSNYSTEAGLTVDLLKSALIDGCECCPYSGRFESYDGKRIWIESRNEWSVAIPLTEFTHWRAVNEPLPPEPKEGE